MEFFFFALGGRGDQKFNFQRSLLVLTEYSLEKGVQKTLIGLVVTMATKWVSFLCFLGGLIQEKII